MVTARADHEIAHGKELAKGDPALIWGWGTMAGRLRAIRRAEMIASGAHLRSGIRVLEIGCGTGIFTEMFAQTGAEIVAVDISADLLKVAKARDLSVAGVQFLERRFEECDVDGPFDAVIGSSVLHHLDLESALPRILTLLKPAGVISFAEPNMLNPQVFIERKLSYLPCFWYVSPDETAFIRHRLRSVLKRFGFEKIEVKPFDWLHPATPARLIHAVRNVARILEKVPIIREFAGSLYIRCRRPNRNDQINLNDNLCP